MTPKPTYYWECSSTSLASAFSVVQGRGNTIVEANKAVERAKSQDRFLSCTVYPWGTSDASRIHNEIRWGRNLILAICLEKRQDFLKASWQWVRTVLRYPLADVKIEFCDEPTQGSGLLTPAATNDSTSI